MSLAAFMTYLNGNRTVSTYGYHTGLLVTIGLMAAGVAVSYLRPRGRAVSGSEPTAAVAELTTVDELAADLMR